MEFHERQDRIVLVLNEPEIAPLHVVCQAVRPINLNSSLLVRLNVADGVMGILQGWLKPGDQKKCFSSRQGHERIKWNDGAVLVQNFHHITKGGLVLDEL